MSKDLAKLVVKLEAQTAKYQQGLERAENKLKRFEKNAKKSIDGVKGLFAGLTAGLISNAVIDATVKQEAALAQLEQRIKSTGGAAGFTTKELASFAGELQNVSTFGDEDLIGAMSQLATFTNITGEEFKGATVAVANLSVAMDQDLKSSVLQIGKALNDPVAGLSALSRAGIQFNDDQKDLIKTLVETGDTAEAQRVILAELETQFGGSAKAARETFGGSIQGLKNAFGDLLEADGGLNDARSSIESLTSTLSDPAVKEGINSLASGIVTAFGGAIKVISSLIAGILTLAKGFAEFVNGPILDSVESIDAELEKKRAKLADEVAKRRDDNKRSNAGGINQVATLKAEIAALEETRAIYESFSSTGLPTPLALGGSSSGIESVTGVSTEGASAGEEISVEDRPEMKLIEEYTQAWRDAQAEINQIVAEGVDARTGLEKIGIDAQKKTVIDGLSSITGEVASSNKAFFKANKAAKIAQALIAMPSHISETMSKYPFPVSVAMGGLAAAQSLMQVRTIKGASFNGTSSSGSTPSTSGVSASLSTINRVASSFSTDDTGQEAEPQKIVNVSLNNAIDTNLVRDFIEVINDTVGDNTEVRAIVS